METRVIGTTSEERALARKIDAAGWGLVLVWIGVALLAHAGWGAGLIGVGAISLGVQAWKKHAQVKVERFSVMLGILLVACGTWTVFDVRLDLVPLLFIAAGAALLFSAMRHRRAPGDAPPAHGHAP